MPLPTFTTKTDNVDIIYAADVNELQNEVAPTAAASAHARYSTSYTSTTNVTLSDTSMPLQSINFSSASNLTLPAVSTDNHPFYFVNRSTASIISILASGGSTLDKVQPGAMAFIVPDSTAGYKAMVSDNYSVHINDFRLSLTSATPETISDVTGATTIYATQDTGNQISLWNGSQFVVYTSTQFSLALGTLTSGKNYDVFCYASGVTPTLEALAWTSDSARATALTTQNGVLVKSGDATRRYLGTFRTTSTTTTEDSTTKRFLYNQNNQRMRLLARINTTSHAYVTAAWRYWNNDQANSQVEFVVGQGKQALGVYRANVTVAGGGGVGFSFDGNTPAGSKGEQFNNAADVASSDYYQPAAGYHYWVGVEFGSLTTERISMTMVILM